MNHPSGRLHDMLENARDQGQIVMLGLFDNVSLTAESNRYKKSLWYPNPNKTTLKACEDLPPGDTPCLPKNQPNAYPEFYHQKMWAIYDALVERVLKTADDFDNVFVEVMNEARHENDTDLGALEAWHQHITRLIHDHGLLAAGNLAGSTYATPFPQDTCDLYSHKTDGSDIDIISLHWDQWSDKQGVGQPKQALADMHTKFKKPIIIDTDGWKQRTDIGVVAYADQTQAYTGDPGSAHYNTKGGIEHTCNLNCAVLASEGLTKGFVNLSKTPRPEGSEECPDGGSGPPGAPDAPELSKPVSDGWTDATPKLQWIAAAGADSYKLQIITPAGATLDYPNITDTFKNIPTNAALQDGKVYKWWVKSCNGSGCSHFGAQWRFKVQTSASIDLGSDTDDQYTNGIAHPQVGDGATEIKPITTAPTCSPGNKSVTLRRNIGGASNDKYFYFRIWDGFIYDKHDGSGKEQTDFKIKIQFWNHVPNGEMCIYYDGYDDQTGDPVVLQAGCITLGTTDCMRWVEFNVNYARFKNGLAGQSDIRVQVVGDPIPQRYINALTVTRE